MEFWILVIRLVLVLIFIGFALKGFLWLIYCIKHKTGRD